MVKVRSDLLRAALLFAVDVADDDNICDWCRAVNIAVTGQGSVAITAATQRHLMHVELAPWGGQPSPASVWVSRQDAIRVIDRLDLGSLGVRLNMITGVGVEVSAANGSFAVVDQIVIAPGGLADLAHTPPTAPADAVLTASLDLAQLGWVSPHFEALCPCNLESNPGQFEVRPGRRAVVIRGGTDHELLNVTYILNTEKLK